MRFLTLTIVALKLLAFVAPARPDDIVRVFQPIGSPIPPAVVLPQPQSTTVDVTLRGKVVGPEGDAVTVGAMVKLRAALTVTRDATTVLLETPDDGYPTAYEWELTNPPDGYSVAEWIGDDGRTLTFSTDQPGAYNFVLAISKWSGGVKPLLRLTRYTLTVAPRGVTPAPKPPITTPAPSPPIVPTPTPPAPTPPDPVPVPPKPAPPTDGELGGLFGLGPKVRDKIAELVPEEYRKKSAALADVYRDVALGVKRGEINAANASKKIREMNATVLTTDAEREAWDGFFAWAGTEMGKLAATGKLTGPKSIVVALSEISLGLSLVEDGP